MAKTETKKRKDAKKEAKALREKNKKYAIVTFQSWTVETRAPSFDDKWDAGDSSTNWTIPNIFSLSDELRYHSEPISFEPVIGQHYFMVYVIWSTGDSFGHYENSDCECFGIYMTREDAEKRKKELENTENNVPWNQYFNSLSSINIHAIAYVP